MMKHRLISIIFTALAILFLTVACDRNEGNVIIDNEGEELIFAASIGNMENVTKGSANLFFELNDSIKVTIQSSRTGTDRVSFIYTYSSDGIFRGIPGYKFSLDDNYIESLTAVWPAEADENGIFIADQRLYANHRKADWLVATASALGVMPTDVPVPLYFQHNNSLLEFELVGQNAQGLTIKELLLELEVDGKPVACWAYCGNENGRASFLLKSGTELSSEEGYMIGTIPGASDSRYTIIMPETNITFEPGKRYLVTLTPRGYFLDAYIEIGGWIEDLNTGIGVPFHHPSEGEDGDYVISTPVQLITMSYLMRHYTDGTTIDWPNLTYTLTDDFVMTEEFAELYIPVPRSLFKGTIIYMGSPIEIIFYDGDKELNLFVNE